MSKISILRKKVVETVEKIDDEAILTSMLVFASTAVQAPLQIQPKTKKARTPKPTEKISNQIQVVEYEFKGKKMIAAQIVDGKPSEAILATLRDFKGVGKLRFYNRAPSNPFNNNLPFWAGPADEALKTALAVV